MSVGIDLNLQTIVFGQSSALESVDVVTILADIEEELEEIFGTKVDCFELLLSNQGTDISVQSFSALIFELLHEK